MFSQMSLVDLVTPAGIYVGKRTLFKITETDRRRINRIVVKIVKGLFYNYFNETVPEDWLVKVCWITPQMEKKLMLPQLAQKLRWNVIKEDTFAYGFDFVSKTNQSLFLIDFFKVPLFFVLVIDKETAASEKKANT